MWSKESLEGFTFGVHALGAINGITFTNSLDAFLLWYKNGIKMFEVDIERTDDGEYVACHIFKKNIFEQMELSNVPSVCTKEWFLEQKLYPKSTSGLNTLDLEGLFKLLRQYSDCMIMIDPKVYSYDLTKELLVKIEGYINEYNIDGKRIVFELYNRDMIEAISQFENMVQFQYCIDDEIQMGTSSEIRALPLEVQLEILRQNEIHIISYPWKFAVERLEVLKKLKEEHFVIFSKTKNNIFSELLKKAGVNVNLVDYLINEQEEQDLQVYKADYYAKYEAKIVDIFG
ncbi:MAG: hypothetical protein PUF03_07925 [Lachnospiraceae bacterium]|nr:hypothetical protein [Lachnospiraceae bacterium]